MLKRDDVSLLLRLTKLGVSKRRISRDLGISRNTVRRYIDAGQWIPHRTPVRPGKLAGLTDWLESAFHAHHGNCVVVRRLLVQEHGVTVSHRTVLRACQGFRRAVKERIEKELRRELLARSPRPKRSN